MHNRPFFILLLLMCPFFAYCQILSDSALKKEPIYTSLEDALCNSTKVYRLKIKIKADSLPNEIFQLVNLQELTASRCKLKILNEQIDKLPNLTYLNIMGNHLTKLPKNLGNLVNLRQLIISRNLIEELPESIGNLIHLTYIDAWENPLYYLPESITNLKNTLKIIDLRQIDLRDSELTDMEKLLPYTDIKFTSTCDCHSTRGKF